MARSFDSAKLCQSCSALSPRRVRGWNNHELEGGVGGYRETP